MKASSKARLSSLGLFAQDQWTVKKLTLNLGLRLDRFYGKTLPLTITARMESLEGQPTTWIIGVSPLERESAVLRYGPLKAMGASLQTTWNSAASTFNMIGKMVSGQASTKNLSGVIGIAQVANASASMGATWFIESATTSWPGWLDAVNGRIQCGPEVQSPRG